MSGKEPMFPIMGDPIIKALPWSLLAPHEEQAMRNHGGQTLKRLAERGGLGIAEAYCTIRGRTLPSSAAQWNKPQVRVALMRMARDESDEGEA